MIDKLEESKLVPFRADQITVNVYEPGAGIPQHVETHSAFEVLHVFRSKKKNLQKCLIKGYFRMAFHQLVYYPR